MPLRPLGNPQPAFDPDVPIGFELVPAELKSLTAAAVVGAEPTEPAQLEMSANRAAADYIRKRGTLLTDAEKQALGTDEERAPVSVFHPCTGDPGWDCQDVYDSTNEGSEWATAFGGAELGAKIGSRFGGPIVGAFGSLIGGSVGGLIQLFRGDI